MNKSNRSQFKLETDLLCLRSFVAVVEEGGFSAAAKRIHRTQSAISVQIAKLEDQLNAKLLERTSRSVSITPAGETFLSYARRILQLADEATLAVIAPEEATLLRIGFAEYLAPEHLDTLLATFRKTHPHCDLSLDFGMGFPLLKKMDRGELDIVFSGSERNNGQKLWEEQLVWTGTNNSPDDSNTPMQLVLMPAPCAYRKIVFDNLTKIAKPWKISTEANTVQAVQSSIRAGLGVTILPRSSVREGMPIIENCLPDLPTTAVMSHVSADQSHPYAQRFIDYLITSIG